MLQLLCKEEASSAESRNIIEKHFHVFLLFFNVLHLNGKWSRNSCSVSVSSLVGKGAAAVWKKSHLLAGNFIVLQVK